MADVRIDANGVPKAAVFEQTAPVAHRVDVTEPDEDDPASAGLGIASEGYRYVDFDIAITLGGTDPLVEVAPLYYDATSDAWFRGDSCFYTESGRYRLRIEARGATVYLQVVALAGTSPTLALSAWASCC